MSKINQGYPGDRLSETRRKYIEGIRRQQNIRTGYSCIWYFLIFVQILCILLFLYGKFQGWW